MSPTTQAFLWGVFVGLTVGGCMGLLTAALLLANDGAERMDRP